MNSMLDLEPRTERAVDLRRLLAAALERCPRARWIAEPPALLTHDERRVETRDAELGRAHGELTRLHRAELAFVLREAARLRLQRASERDFPAWRRAFRECLRCAVLDGVRVPRELFQLLLRCRTASAQSLPNAVELATAALALHEVEPARERLGEALLAAERTGEACVAFVLAAESATCASDRARLLAQARRSDADLFAEAA